jgi:hypothetical protein
VVLIPGAGKSNAENGFISFSGFLDEYAETTCGKGNLAGRAGPSCNKNHLLSVNKCNGASEIIASD